jgi:hypothetical protein
MPTVELIGRQPTASRCAEMWKDGGVLGVGEVGVEPAECQVERLL